MLKKKYCSRLKIDFEFVRDGDITGNREFYGAVPWVR